MATRTKKAVAKNDSNGNGNGKEVDSDDQVLRLTPIRKMLVSFTIRGVTPLVQHQWSEKSIGMLRDKHAGKKTRNREVRDPAQEGKDATYFTDDGHYGIPAMAIKKSLLLAAHKDLGVARNLVAKALFIVTNDSKKLLPMDCDEPVIHEDTVRVGQGTTDLRYRPYFNRWSVPVTFEIDSELLRVEDLINLADRAGFGIGVLEMRPEKLGEYGRFEVDRTQPITTS